MFKVVITDYIGPEVEPEKALIDDLAEIVCLRARSVAELEGRVEDADAIIIFHEVTLPGELIDRLENCRVIARGGVGYDAVDFRRAGDPLWLAVLGPWKGGRESVIKTENLMRH